MINLSKFGAYDKFQWQIYMTSGHSLNPNDIWKTNKARMEWQMANSYNKWKQVLTSDKKWNMSEKVTSNTE